MKRNKKVKDCWKCRNGEALKSAIPKGVKAVEVSCSHCGRSTLDKAS